MSLEQATQENLETIVEDIKTELRIVNASLIRAEDFSLESYEDLYDLYLLVQKKKGKLTMMEVEGILEELRDLKKTK